jgi:tryptophan synthase alpha chain
MGSSRQRLPGNNRLTLLFSRKKQRVLNVYCTAGYPRLDSTLEVMQALEANGADIIELGMPYSDPLADGPVIQESGGIALQNGMTIDVLFRQLQGLRKKVQVPVVLMGYLNPVLQYGVEKFCADAAAVGVDGIILPDLPAYEFETLYRTSFEKHGLHFIFLVTPETPEERIRKIDALSSGFLYAVSSSSTTGNEKPIALQEAYFKRLAVMGLKNPVLVGFGIKDRSTFNAAVKYTAGAIIGSAYIRVLGEGGDIGPSTKEFLNSILGKV